MDINRNVLIAFAIAAMVAATIWVIWLTMSAPGELKAEHWLGFFGNVFGGGMTLLAALAAWIAVRAQNAEQRRAVELARRDAANLRLAGHATTLITFKAKYDETISKENRNPTISYTALRGMRRDPDMLSVLMDPLMGKDIDAVARFVEWADTAAARVVNNWGERDNGRFRYVTEMLSFDLTENILERRKRMRANGVDALTDLQLIDIKRFSEHLDHGRSLVDDTWQPV